MIHGPRRGDHITSVISHSRFEDTYACTPDFPGGSDGKASVYNVGDPSSIPGSGRFPGERNATHSSALAWRIPWTEELGRLQSIGVTKSQT